MHSKKHIVLWGALVVVMGMPCAVFSADADATVRRAREVARQGQPDFAFSYLGPILAAQVLSPAYAEALFASGQYYMRINNPLFAQAAFESFIEKFPSASQGVFARAYLVVLARQRNDTVTAVQQEACIARSKHVGLVFREWREYRYVSVLNVSLIARYFIDRVEVYADDAIVLTVSLVPTL